MWITGGGAGNVAPPPRRATREFRSMSRFAGRLAQRIVDAILPTGTLLLEVLQDVFVDPQRNHLLDAGKRRRLRGTLDRFRCRCLERGFRRLERIAAPPRAVIFHCPTPLPANLFAGLAVIPAG